MVKVAVIPIDFSDVPGVGSPSTLIDPEIAQAKKWIDATPNLEEMFKKQCKAPEELVEVLEQFVSNLTSGFTASASGTDHTESRTGKAVSNPTADKLDDAFADM